jgi:hypothetical protein
MPRPISPLAFALKLADDAHYKAELALSPTQLRPVDFLPLAEE